MVTRKVIVRDYCCSQGSVKLLALFSCGLLVLDSANKYALYNYDFCQKPSITSFPQLSQEEKLEVKRLGPGRSESSTKSGSSSRRFTKTWYPKYIWLTGCSQSGKLYCFPCLLIGNSSREKAWNQSGVNDWTYLSVKVN